MLVGAGAGLRPSLVGVPQEWPLAQLRTDPLIGGSNDYDLDLIRSDLAGSLATHLWQRSVYVIGEDTDISSVMVVKPPT